MPDFEVQVTIENKPGVSDPEGETILKDLVMKHSHESVSQIRTAKVLVFLISGQTPESAQDEVQKICDELRIYNPVVSRIRVRTDPASKQN